MNSFFSRALLLLVLNTIVGHCATAQTQTYFENFNDVTAFSTLTNRGWLQMTFSTLVTGASAIGGSGVSIKSGTINNSAASLTTPVLAISSTTIISFKAVLQSTKADPVLYVLLTTPTSTPTTSATVAVIPTGTGPGTSSTLGTSAQTYAFTVPNTATYPRDYRIQFYVITTTNGNGGNDLTIDDVSVTNSTLPVTLVSFTGQQGPEGNMLLTWKTSSETNSKSFVVERSADLQQWYVLGDVPSIGVSGQSYTYRFIDKAPLRTGYYRLIQIDSNGTATYTKPIALTNKSTTDLDPLLIGYKADQQEVTFRQNTEHIAFPLVVQFYSLSGHLLSTNLVTQPTDHFNLAAPSTRNPLMLVRVVDATQQVLTKRILMTD